MLSQKGFLKSLVLVLSSSKSTRDGGGTLRDGVAVGLRHRFLI